jgi:hypothetical protein
VVHCMQRVAGDCPVAAKCDGLWVGFDPGSWLSTGPGAKCSVSTWVDMACCCLVARFAEQALTYC